MYLPIIGLGLASNALENPEVLVTIDGIRSPVEGLEFQNAADALPLNFDGIPVAGKTNLEIGRGGGRTPSRAISP